MKSNTHCYLIYLFAFAMLTACNATTHTIKPTVLIKESARFADVVATASLMNNKYQAKNVLIVLDIDNTLLTSTTDIGGDIWYQWQRGKLDLKPTEEQKVACLFEDSIGLLYELGPMTLTESSLPDIITNWQKNGNTLMALTSRAPKHRSATERELASNNINMALSALAPIGQQAPVYRETTTRELSYMKGVMMTSGMNKGEMLKYILEKTKRSFDAIIFVDDSQANIDAIYAEYKTENKVEMTIFHYTKVEEDRIHQQGVLLTNAQVSKMENDWEKLNLTLNEVFPTRQRQGCLSVN